MQETDKLKVSILKAAADAMINKLEDDNADLKIAQTAFNNFIYTDEMYSHALETMISIANDYNYAIGAMLTANDYDIDDCKKLKSSIGSEDYDGSVIIPKMNEAKKNWDDAENAATDAYNQLRSCKWWQFFSQYAACNMFNTYTSMANSYSKEYNKWKKKADAFDAINSSTSGLFSNADSYRDKASEGLTQLAGSVSSDGITRNYDTKWRDELIEERNRVVDAKVAEYVSFDSNDNPVYDWDNIDKYLKANPDSLKEEDYIAMAKVIDTMDTASLQKLLNASVWENKKNSSAFLGVYEYDRSQTLQNAVNYFSLIANMQAEMTIFNDDKNISLTDEQRAYFYNQHTKSIMLSLATERIMTNSIGDDVIVDIKECTGDGQAIYYQVELTPFNAGNLSNSASLGDVLCDSVNQRTFTVYPCVDGFNLDNYGDDLVLKTLAGFDQSWSSFAVDQVVNYAADKVVSTGAKVLGDVGGEIVSVLFSVGKDAIQNTINHINVEGISDMALLVNIFGEMGIYGSICHADGIFTNETRFASVKIDPEELYIKLYVYNQSNSGNDYTVQDVRNALNGGDSAVLTDFHNWYKDPSKAANTKIENFYTKLDTAYMSYVKEHPNAPVVDKMDATELQQLIEYMESM